MPIARGIMQVGRVNVYQTSCILDRIEPTEGYCGAGVVFYVSVNNLFPGVTVTGGTFDIINTNNNSIIASGNISSGSGNTTPVTNLSENINVIARYNGLNNQFNSSFSSTAEYHISRVYTQTIIITPEPEAYYCYHEPLTITAEVQSVVPTFTSFPSSPIPTGNVQFIFTQVDEEPIIIGQSPLNGSGQASIVMPADTGIQDSGSIIAYYLGEGCFEPSYETVRVVAISNDPTSIVLGSTTASPLYTYNPINLTAGITGTDLPNPSDGIVHFYAISGASTIDLGNYPVTSGIASTTIPPGTLTAGIWDAAADYIPSSTECYLGSGPATRRLVILP